MKQQMPGFLSITQVATSIGLSYKRTKRLLIAAGIELHQFGTIGQKVDVTQLRVDCPGIYEKVVAAWAKGKLKERRGGMRQNSASGGKPFRRLSLEDKT